MEPSESSSEYRAAVEEKNERKERRLLYGKILYEDLYEWTHADKLLSRSQRDEIQNEACTLLPQKEKEGLLHYTDLTESERRELDAHIHRLAAEQHREDFWQRYWEFREYQRSKFRNNWFHLVFFTLSSILDDEFLDGQSREKFQKKLHSLERALAKMNSQHSLSREEERGKRLILIERTERLVRHVLKKLYPHTSRMKLAKIVGIL